MTQRSNIVKLRLTDLEKQDWQTAAGGARRLSEWVRSVCNAACVVPHEAASMLDSAAAETVLPNAKPKLVADAIERGAQPKAQCDRWMHHRPGVYCGSCKKVIAK